jgi:four helix bundle protein
MVGRDFATTKLISWRSEMNAQSEELKGRTIVFAINVLDLVDRLPTTPRGKVIAYQLAKCSTSVGANYRASCNGRSRREFIAKLGTVVEESEESVYWLEIIKRSRIVVAPEVAKLLQESIELRAIFSSSLGTARENARAARAVGRKRPNDQTTK